MGAAQRDDALTSLFAELSCVHAAGFRAAGFAGVAVAGKAQIYSPLEMP
jgi:hypothetical protein